MCDMVLWDVHGHNSTVFKRMGEVKALGAGRFVITEVRYNARDQR